MYFLHLFHFYECVFVYFANDLHVHDNNNNNNNLVGYTIVKLNVFRHSPFAI